MNEQEKLYQEELERLKNLRYNDSEFFGTCTRCNKEFDYGEMRKFYPDLRYFDVRIDYKCPDCGQSLAPF